MTTTELEAARLFMTDDELAELVTWWLHWGGVAAKGRVKTTNAGEVYAATFLSRPGVEDGLLSAYAEVRCPVCNWTTESDVVETVTAYLNNMRKAALIHHRAAHLESALRAMKAHYRTGGSVKWQILQRNWYE